MIGDLILIFIFAIIWQRILKLRKTNFREFIFEFSIYLSVFCLNLILYKFSSFVLSFIFDFGLFPSIVGVFALSFIILYVIARFSVYYLFKKKHWTLEKREEIIEKEVNFFDFFIHSLEDFQKVFVIFFVINLVVMFTLLNSFMDVFTHQRVLNYKNSKALDVKMERMINDTKSDKNFKDNLSQTLKFLKIVDPRAYEKIIKHTDSFVISESIPGNLPTSDFIAYASFPEMSITFKPVFTKPFNSLDDQIYFSMLMVHEAEHLKNFRENSGFIANSLNYIYLKAKCNPVTNYQYFSNIRRAHHMYGDEWCAQISEVKFLKQFNISYEEDWMKHFDSN